MADQPPRRAPSPWPVSYTQGGFWEMAQAIPDEPLRNISGLWLVTGPLDEEALREALVEIHRRHDLLRTRFAASEQGPMAHVEDEVLLDFEVVDLTVLLGKQAEQQALEAAERLRRAAFRVTERPLFRARLYRLEPQRFMLLMMVDHIVFDGWSYGVFLGELNRLYPAACEGRRSPLPELPVQFSGFAAWERERLQGERLAALWDHWRERLRGNLPAIPLPSDHPRPRPYRHAMLPFSLSAELSRALRDFSRRHRVSLFMSLLAGFHAFLCRLGGLDEISVVVPVANRRIPETRLLIGPTINLIVVRIRLEDDPPFEELVQRVRRTCLEAYAHEEMPFELLLQRLQQSGSYSAMLAMENYPLSPLQLGGCTVQQLDADAGAAFYDFTMVFFDSQPRIDAYLAYNAELFEPRTIRRYVRDFEALLRSAVSAPGQRISRLPISDGGATP
jgi:hypothetical protein